MTTLQFFDEAKKVGTTVPTMGCPVCHASHVPLEKSALSDGVYACTCQNCGHFFKFKARGPIKSDVTLMVNGKTYTVGSDVSATTSLNEYLRSLGLRGTKYMCYQGGCGLCLVCVKLYEPITMKPQTYAINSCLCPVLSCDGWEVTTIEGLGNPQDGLHPIQERLADHNGSQCGFCSPGQVMNMYGLMAYNQDLGQKFTMKQVEDAFDATICRCTGYRAILDAMKSFASDAPPPGGHVDIEDLDKRLCKKTGQACSGKCGHHGDEACAPSHPPTLHLVLGDAQWFRPSTLKELYALVQQYRDSGYRLTFGNTAGAVYGDMGSYGASVLIDMRGIRELYSVSFDPTWQLGANVSLSQLLDVFTRMKSDVSLKYFVEFEAHTRKIASTSVRNMACWTGNLMMKRQHPEFVSDIFVMFETIGTQLWIGHADGTDDEQVSLTDFLKMDMKGKVILGAFLPTFVSDDVYIKTYKVSRRTQNAHAHVSAGFFFRLDKSNNYLVKAKPSIVYTGISPTFNHAAKTEAYLQGKQLGDPAVLKGALAMLQSEVVPTVDPAQASPIYRRSLALALFYKFVLACCPDKADARFQSGASTLSRPVHTASHSYDTDPSEYPVSKPMTKRDATLQTSGVLQYTNDVPPQPDELYAAFVLSTVASAKILSIDSSAAMNVPGVLRFISAADIPKGGINNCMPGGATEEVFCSGQVQYCGQAVGLIVATSEAACFAGVAAVKVNYTDVQPPILTIQDAIAKQSFFPNVGQEVKVGDAEAAIKSSAKTIQGTISMGGQQHFQLENQITICTPTDEGGMDVKAATQWIDFAQLLIAQVLNIPVSKINVETRRLGGAYGAKITRNFPVSAACALAAYIMRRPVRLSMTMSSNMKMLGGRFPYLANYEVGLSSSGQLNGVKIEYYANCGINANDNSLSLMPGWIDNAYHCPNWHLIPHACKTNLPVMSYARSPGSCAAIFIMESIMEHAAKAMDMDPTALRKLNFVQNGQTTPGGYPVKDCTLQPVYDKLDQLVDLTTRQQQVDAFNKANRWKKRGCSVVPIKFGIGWTGAIYSVMVNIYHGDGSVAVAHGGIESGQGINTKVAQVVAFEFGIPIEQIQIKKSSTMTNANSITTGGSVTSELNCMGAIECCKQLSARMAPVKAKMVNPTWKQLVAQCYAEGVDLVAQYSTNPGPDPGGWHYCCYGATYCETELDVLTGEREILRSDMVYDCGVSLNPEIDVGQAEGAYVMGLGYYLQEELVYDTQTGANLTATTWEYKPPLHQDTPDQLNITLLPKDSNPVGVLRSKAVGEPPLTMSCAALFALKHAAMAARAEISKNDFFPLNAPATVEMVQRSSLVEPDQFVFGK